MFAANREFSDSGAEYSVPSTASLVCFRIVAIIVISFATFIPLLQDRIVYGWFEPV